VIRDMRLPATSTWTQHQAPEIATLKSADAADGARRARQSDLQWCQQPADSIPPQIRMRPSVVVAALVLTLLV